MKSYKLETIKIEKINETMCWLFEKIEDKKAIQPDSSREKSPRSIKSEMKKKLQPTSQKYQRSEETIPNNYTLTQKKLTNS